MKLIATACCLASLLLAFVTALRARRRAMRHRIMLLLGRLEVVLEPELLLLLLVLSRGVCCRIGVGRLGLRGEVGGRGRR